MIIRSFALLLAFLYSHKINQGIVTIESHLFRGIRRDNTAIDRKVFNNNHRKLHQIVSGVIIIVIIIFRENQNGK